MSPRWAQCVIPVGQRHKNRPLQISNTDSLPRGQSCPADNKQSRNLSIRTVTTAKLSQFRSTGRPVRSNEILVRRDAQVKCDTIIAIRNRWYAKFATIPQSWVITHTSRPCLVDASLQRRWQRPSIVTVWQTDLQTVTRYMFLFWWQVHYLYIGIHRTVYCLLSIKLRSGTLKQSVTGKLADCQLTDISSRLVNNQHADKSTRGYHRQQ